MVNAVLALFSAFQKESSLPCHQLVRPLRIEADHYFVSDHQRRRGVAVVGADQLKDKLFVGGNVALFVFDTSILEVGLSRSARRSARLREENDLLRHGRNG